MTSEPLDRELSDGVVTLRSPRTRDAAVLMAGRDTEFHRFMGEGSSEPNPTAVVLAGAAEIVGWIDYDMGREWLVDGEVNIGYNIFQEHRRLGLAKRSLALLISFLEENVEFTAATLLIDPANTSSIALAERCGFDQHDTIDGQIFYKRAASAR